MSTSMHDAITRVLRTIHDPEIPVNIHDLGLIYGLEIEDDGAVCIRMTLTSPNCPMAEQIVADVRRKVLEVDGVSHIAVELVWEPTWDPSMLSEAARLELDFTGKTVPRPGPSTTPLTFDRRKENP